MPAFPIQSPIIRFWNKGGFVLCTRGYADVKLNEQAYRLSEGEILFITPLIQIFSFTPSADYEEISFMDDLKVFYPVFQGINDTQIPLKVRENPVWPISEEEIEFIRYNYRNVKDRLSEIEEEDLEVRRLIKIQIDLIKQLTVLEIVRKRVTNIEYISANQRNQTTIAYKFILSLHEHYIDQRSVSWYASQANLSSGHFTSIIKSVIGMSPSRLISLVTTTYAKIQLEMTNKSIKEIAAELNFPEQFTFRKYFKLHTGLSPKEYRQQSKDLPSSD